MTAVMIPKFYPIIDTCLLSNARITPEHIAELMASMGVGIVQFRHKGQFTRKVLTQAEKIGKILHNAGVKYIINDRADVAKILCGSGVHIGQDDLSASKVRLILGDSDIIGVSTHNEEQLCTSALEPADYFAVGPIFETHSKDNPDAILGLTGLSNLRKLTSKPLVAIGGIDLTNARQVLNAGADSVAVISSLIAAPEELAKRIADWMEVVS